jgi:hypothetical protein
LTAAEFGPTVAGQPASSMVTSKGQSTWHIPPDLLLCFLPGIIGLGVSFIYSPVPLICLMAAVCGVTGLMLLGRARFPLYRQRRFFTFGCAALDEAHRKLYRRAYCWIGCCMALLLVLNVIVRWKL